MIQAKRKQHKPPDAVAELIARLERIQFVTLHAADGQSRLTVTETVSKGVWRSAVLVGNAQWSEMPTAQRLADVVLSQIAGLGFLPSHAARRRGLLLAMEVLWGLPAAGWQLSAADVWAWYYRRVSGPELRRRIANGAKEEAAS